MKNRKQMVIGIVIALTVAIVGGALIGEGFSATDNDSSTEVITEGGETTEGQGLYAIEDVAGSIGDCGMGYDVVGKFVNKSGKEISYISLTYNLYDADGDKIGDAYANTSGLEKDGSWKFKAVGFLDDATPSDVASYKLVKVNIL